VIMSGGAARARVVRSLPRPFARPGIFDQAGVQGPTPGHPVRIPLGAMRWRARGGTLIWETEAPSATVAYFEISVE
jgi:hypothetical protein